MQFASHFTTVGERLTGETFSKFRAVLRLSHCLGMPSPLTLPFMRDVFFFFFSQEETSCAQCGIASGRFYDEFK
jgi:hypothetical protein